MPLLCKSLTRGTRVYSFRWILWSFPRLFVWQGGGEWDFLVFKPSNTISVWQNMLSCDTQTWLSLQIPDLQVLRHKVNWINPVLENEDTDISFSYRQRARRRETKFGRAIYTRFYGNDVRTVTTFWWGAVILTGKGGHKCTFWSSRNAVSLSG